MCRIYHTKEETSQDITAIEGSCQALLECVGKLYLGTASYLKTSLPMLDRLIKKQRPDRVDNKDPQHTDRSQQQDAIRSYHIINYTSRGVNTKWSRTMRFGFPAGQRKTI